MNTCRSRPLSVFAVLLILLLAFQASVIAATSPAKVGADANNNFIVEPAWLAKNIDSTSLVIIDARSAAAYQKKHIKNAINIPVSKTYSAVDPKDRVASIQHIQKLFGDAGIDATSNIIIYDGGEFINAGRIFWVLEVYGHRRVALLKYGLPGWIQDSFPESDKTHHLAARKFIAEVQPNRLKTKLHTRLAIADVKKIIIDSRSAEEYAGKISFSGRAGHIPGAISIPWNKNFKNVNGVSTIRDMSQLKSIYKDIKPGKQIITYCNKGRHSSFTYMILRQLGHDVSHYDGSWNEWGNDESLPIESGS